VRSGDWEGHKTGLLQVKLARAPSCTNNAVCHIANGASSSSLGKSLLYSFASKSGYDVCR
jgi:hypothetical protein